MRIFNFRREIAAKEEGRVTLLSPESIEAVIPGRTRLSWPVWYKAIYAVWDDHDITANKLSIAAGVSHVTARSMKKEIVEKLGFGIL